MSSLSRTLSAAAAALTLAAAPLAVMAQTAPAAASMPAENDAVAALLGSPAPNTAPAPGQTSEPAPQASADAALELKGETNGPAPDSEQRPVELSITQRLNAEVVAQDELAEQTDRANQAEYKADVAEYEDAVADNQAERERIAIDAQINTQSRAEYDADQESRYQKAMADWRATNEACQRGDTARCRAGSMPARPGN